MVLIVSKGANNVLLHPAARADAREFFNPSLFATVVRRLLVDATRLDDDDDDVILLVQMLRSRRKSRHRHCMEAQWEGILVISRMPTMSHL
jgi:hypothetical protein